MREHGLFIQGRWEEARDGGRFDVVDPATGGVARSVSVGSGVG